MDGGVKRAAQELTGGEDAVGVRADGEEGGVAQVEKAGEADDDVETEGQQDVDPGIARLADEGAAVAAGEDLGDEGPQEREQQQGVG